MENVQEITTAYSSACKGALQNALCFSNQMGIGECDKQYNYVYENWSQLLLLLFIFVGKVWQNNDL